MNGFTRIPSGTWWYRRGRLLIAWDAPQDRRDDGWVPLSVREGWQKQWRIGGLEVSWRVRTQPVTISREDDA